MSSVKVKEHPMLFGERLVQPLLDDRKTQSRRLIKPPLGSGAKWEPWEGEGTYKANGLLADIPVEWRSKILYCPYRVGDLIWVRETWQVWSEFDKVAIKDLPSIAHVNVNYPADGNNWFAKFRPSIHMPKWAARIWLEITDVRVERVNEISWEDAAAEGMEIQEHSTGDGGTSYCYGCLRDWGCTQPHPPGGPCPTFVRGYVTEFRNTWQALYPGSWERNDWVWAIDFKRTEKPQEQA